MRVKILKTKHKILHLKEDEEYEVICISFIRKDNNDFSIMYRILNDQGTIALYGINDFLIVDSFLESDYVYIKSSDFSYLLIPKCMNQKGYWEDFFNQNEIAVNIFKNRFPHLKDKIFI